MVRESLAPAGAGQEDKGSGEEDGANWLQARGNDAGGHGAAEGDGGSEAEEDEASGRHEQGSGADAFIGSGGDRHDYQQQQDSQHGQLRLQDHF